MMKKGTKPKIKNEIKANQKLYAERMSDKAVLLSALTILYGILLLFLQNMGYSMATVSGAVTFVCILFWGSIAGAMLFAALSVYRERWGLLLYCGIFLYVFWTTAVIRFTGNWAHAYAIVYISLFAVFVLVHVNIWLRTSGRYEKRPVRLAFIIVTAVIFALLTLTAVGLRTGMLSWLLDYISVKR